MSLIELKGMTWDHLRGLDSLVASNELLVSRTAVSVTWDARSLLVFGDQHVEDFYREYDLLVIDHPHVPDAVAAGAILAFEDYANEAVLEELSRTSVGASHDSCLYRGKHWALAIDTAAQVSAFRPDISEGAPIFWSDAFDLGRKNDLLWPYKPVDAFSTFATLMAQKGNPLAGGDSYFDLEVASEVLEFMVELADLVPDWCSESNPIDIAEILATTNDYGNAVAMYGYSNYSRSGFRKNVIHYEDVPSFDGKASGSQLGGAGIAVSAASRDPDAAMKAAQFLALPEVPASTYGLKSGQPGNLVAWKSPRLNEEVHNFFSNTLRTLERAWVRPRVLGWPDVQYETSQVIHKMLTDRKVRAKNIVLMNSFYERYVQE